jgi:RNA polymerase sigma factor (sigma-70 family)
MAGPDELIQTRWSLINRLKDWDDGATWQEFFNTYWRLVYSVARKAGLTDVEAQEVVQETVISVARQMPKFHADPARGSFKAWLMHLTRRRIVDQFRKRPPAGRFRKSTATETARTPLIERVADPAGPALELLWEEEWKENLMKTAIERVKQRVNPKQFQVFHLLTVKKKSPEVVAALLNLKVPYVYLMKHRVAAALKEEIQRLETAGPMGKDRKDQ